jgi:short-subunit dehydrogenase
MAMRKIRGTRFAVTGSSGGIGKALALELARRGGRLVLNARRAEALAETAEAARALGAEVETVAGDVADPVARRTLIDRCVERFGGLDVLVNNAGIGAFGPFEAADEERLRRVMEINFFAAVELTRIAIPVLRAGERPMIVNISSVLGLRGAPLTSEYCASKFALAGWSQSLRAELAGAIDVLVVSPGTTDTSFFDNVIEGRRSTPWRQGGGVPAERVARRIARAMMLGRHHIIPSFGGWLFVMASRCCSPLMDWAMARLARKS